MDRKEIPTAVAPVVIPLGESDFKNLEVLWELWDPFLVFQILALAGAKILELYLRRYGLKRMGPENSLDDDQLSQAVYAMSNGGLISSPSF